MTISTNFAPITPETVEQALLQHGLIDEKVMLHAKQLHGHSNLGTTMVNMGLISEAQLYSTYSQISGLPLWDGEGDDVDDARFDADFLYFNHILPIEKDDQPWLIICEAMDDGLIDMLQQLAPDTQIAFYPKADLTLRLKKHNQIASLENDEEESSDLLLSNMDADHLKDLALEAPIIRSVNEIINNAVHMQASDIHLEPFRRHIELRYRIDGLLLSRLAPTAEEYPAIASRIKILANLDIAERRLPQDGRIRTKSAGRDIDIRVSTIPAPFGEDIVLRILDQKRSVISLENTGLSDNIQRQFQENLHKHNGIILVTGPTGSGKTTTLYSALQHLINGERKIITVEDPVEYEMPGITQIQANESIGMNFSNALRSILRHDPDVIFIGEIRDTETAKIATNAALTGHLVLSTLHTNSAVGAISRFLDMGIPDYLLSSSLLAVCAQRLVRSLCPHCKQKSVIAPHFAARFNFSEDQLIFAPKGCSKCSHTGFHGRLPIAEFKDITPEVRTAIVNDPSPHSLEAAAAKSHPENMLDDGIQKALQGLTTFEEILKITG